MPTPSIQLKRHATRLSDKETDELVNAVAEIVVAFIKSRNGERSLQHIRPRTDEKQPHRQGEPKSCPRQ